MVINSRSSAAAAWVGCVHKRTCSGGTLNEVLVRVRHLHTLLSWDWWRIHTGAFSPPSIRDWILSSNRRSEWYGMGRCSQGGGEMYFSAEWNSAGDSVAELNKCVLTRREYSNIIQRLLAYSSRQRILGHIPRLCLGLAMDRGWFHSWIVALARIYMYSTRGSLYL